MLHHYCRVSSRIVCLVSSYVVFCRCGNHGQNMYAFNSYIFIHNLAFASRTYMQHVYIHAYAQPESHNRYQNTKTSFQVEITTFPACLYLTFDKLAQFINPFGYPLASLSISFGKSKRKREYTTYEHKSDIVSFQQAYSSRSCPKHVGRRHGRMHKKIAGVRVSRINCSDMVSLPR